MRLGDTLVSAGMSETRLLAVYKGEPNQVCGPATEAEQHTKEQVCQLSQIRLKLVFTPTNNLNRE